MMALVEGVKLGLAMMLEGAKLGLAMIEGSRGWQ